jgi:small conductance mechanosensitive channel
MIRQLLASLAGQLGEIALRLALAAVAVWAGLLLTSYAQAAVRRMVRRTRPDDRQVLEALFTRAVQVGGIVLVSVLALAVLGVNVSALVTSLGLTSLALGFALKDVIEQTVTGTLLLLIRPFNIGDVIELDGVEGVVTAVGLRTTELRTGDGVHVLIPNNKVYQSVIRNKTHYPARRYELALRFDCATDIAETQQVLLSAMRMAPQVLSDPPPSVVFELLSEMAILARVRYWLPSAANNAEAQTGVTRTLTEAVRQADLACTDGKS